MRQGFLEATAFALGLEGHLEFGLADKESSRLAETPPAPTGLCVCESTRAHLLFCPALAKQILTARSADRDIGKLKGGRGVSAQWWQFQSSALFLSYQNRGGAPKGKSFRKGLLEATFSQDTSH